MCMGLSRDVNSNVADPIAGVPHSCLYCKAGNIWVGFGLIFASRGQFPFGKSWKCLRLESFIFIFTKILRLSPAFFCFFTPIADVSRSQRFPGLNVPEKLNYADTFLQYTLVYEVARL